MPQMLFTFSFGSSRTGLADSLGYTLRDADERVVGSRVTGGFTERGSGQYNRTVDIPALFVGSIDCDTGGDSPLHDVYPINLAGTGASIDSDEDHEQFLEQTENIT